MVNFDCNDFKILKFIYKLKYDDFGEHLKKTLKVKDSVKLVNMLTELPSCQSPIKKLNNWDMVLIDSENSDIIELILYKCDIEFTIVDMTKYYRDGSETLTNVFVKDIDDFLKTQMELNDILEKVYKKGVDSLNKFEKTFLDNY